MSLTLDETLLDDGDALVAADRSGTLLDLAGAGAQVREAVTLSRESGVGRVADDGRPRAVLVAALGSSAVVADLLAAAAGPGSPVPVQAVHSGTLPGWVSPVDLVVAVSLSGRAEGPLAVAAEAARRGCRLLTVGGGSSPLADIAARAHGIHVPVPERLARSRTSLWSLAVPVLSVGHALDLLDAPTSALEEAADVMDDVAERARPSSESFVNPAKLLALELAGTVPLVLGEGDLAGVAAVRAAAQLARHARHPAMPGMLPDAATAVVATFDGPFAGGSAAADVFADPFLDAPAGPRLSLLLLRDPAVPEHVRRVTDIVRDTAQSCGVKVGWLDPSGEHGLARFASHVAMIDFASAYLALGAGLDPSTSPHVADLRDALRDGVGG